MRYWFIFGFVSRVSEPVLCWFGYRVHHCGEPSTELSWFIGAFSVVFGLVVARQWLRR